MGDRFQKLMQSVSLHCPDDGAALQQQREALHCSNCDRTFHIQHGMFVELLPKAPTSLGDSTSKYAGDYLEEFNKPFQWNAAALAWGAPESFPQHWVQRRQRQVRWAASLLADDRDPSQLTFCDLSGGAGYYSMEYARKFNNVIHCDLSVDSLNYVCAKSVERKLDNMVFLRIDYFRPPFRANIDRLLCFDTLIRGEPHDRLLLQSVIRCLSPQGEALVDFHNWWHNPVRRIGLLPKNFPRGSYSRRQLSSLLRETGMGRSEFFPWYQEFDQSGLLGRIGAKIIPPTRLVYRCRS